jgi:hypothetical protein
MERELAKKKQRILMEQLLRLSNELITRIIVINKSKTIKPWGELKERQILLEDSLILDELCRNMNEERMEHLVNLYNRRDISLDPVEAHFVTKFATNYGYDTVLNTNNQITFKKRQKVKTISNK